MAGRVVWDVPFFSPLLSSIIDGAFLVVVAGLAWREIIAGKSWPQAPIGVLVSLYACANVLFHVWTLSNAETDSAERMGLALVLVLLSLIGGRVTSNFTRDFLAEQGRT